MGSFNTVCGVSKAIIEEGHKVKLMIMNSVGKASNHHCYSNDEFQLIFFPLDAVYTDYGTYEIQENQVSDTILAWIKDHYVVNEGNHHEREFIGIQAEDLNWENIIRAISRDQIYVNIHQYNPRAMLGMMAVHEDVYQVMIKGQDDVGISYDKYLDHSEYLSMLSGLGLNDNIDQEHRDAFEMISLKKEKLSLSDNTILDMATTLIRMKTETKVHDLIGYNRMINSQLIGSVIRLMDDKEFQKIMTDYVFFDAAFNRLYMEYCPTMLGGQTPYHKSHAAMLRSIADVVESLETED